MFCSQCGERLPDNARFCHKCGAPTILAQQTAQDRSGQTGNAEQRSYAGQAQPDYGSQANYGFDIEQFWRERAEYLLKIDGSSKLYPRDRWVVEFVPDIGPRHMNNAVKAAKGAITPEDVIGLVTCNYADVAKKPDNGSGGVVGFCLCREGFGFHTMASMSDAMLWGAGGSLIKMAGKSTPFIRYRDIRSAGSQGKYLHVGLKDGSVKKLYMSAVFNGEAAAAILNELIGMIG